MFSKPGGRRFLENLILIILTNTDLDQEEKEELYYALSSGFGRLEKRIKRQKDGQQILTEVFTK